MPWTGFNWKPNELISEHKMDQTFGNADYLREELRHRIVGSLSSMAAGRKVFTSTTVSAGARFALEIPGRADTVSSAYTDSASWFPLLDPDFRNIDISTLTDGTAYDVHFKCEVNVVAGGAYSVVDLEDSGRPLEGGVLWSTTIIKKIDLDFLSLFAQVRGVRDDPSMWGQTRGAILIAHRTNEPNWI